MTMNDTELDERKSHIKRLYSPDVLKKLFAHALSIEIDDNNVKVDYIKEILGPDFSELGPGTNRFGVLGPDGMCHKIAMDRRGIVDNITEFKRSPDINWCSPNCYETNGVILTVENVELITREEFVSNRENILYICEQLAKNYIFTDIGYAAKNFCNWGIRKNNQLVILDVGYMIPRLGNEEAMMCPICGRELKYTTNYTDFRCEKCGTVFSFIDIFRRLDNKVDDALYEGITGFQLPDFAQFNNTLYNNGIMKGGHIFHGIGEKPKVPADDNSGCIAAEDIKSILDAIGKSNG